MTYRKKVCLLLIVLLQLIFHELNALNSGPKLNISSYEYILKTGDNFAVLCEGNGLLEWDMEDLEDDGEYSEYTIIESIPTTPQTEGFTSAIEMRIFNVTFPYVGIYYCESKGNNSSAPAAFYLYVHDEIYLAATDIMFNDVIVTTQDSSVTLPCIPAAPDVEVSLVKEIEDEMIPIEVGSIYEGKFYDYSQFAGVTTDDTAQIQVTNYRCFFRRGNISVSYPVQVDVEPVVHSISNPLLTEVNPKLRNIEGGTVVLKCQVKSHVRVDFSWKVPMYDEDETDERMDVLYDEKEPDNPDIMYSTLTIRNTTLNDTGEYKCKVIDYQEHQKEVSIDITIFDHLYILFVQEPCSVEKKEGKQNVKCSVGIIAHPLPNVTWYSNKNELVPTESIDNYKEIDSMYMEASLNIKNITLWEVGQYTFFAENEYDNATGTFHVDVIAKPVIELKLEKEYQMVGEKTVIECNVTAFPEPSVKLMYKPCFDITCEYKVLDDVEYYQYDSILIATLKYTFSRSGVIKCVATETVIDDAEESFEKEIGLFISDVEGGFAVEIQKGVQSNDLYHVVVITIEDSIEIKCAAYIQNFTQRIKWKRDSKEIISDEKYEIWTSFTEFSNTSFLNISEINKKDKGFYTCELYKMIGVNEELIRSQDVTFNKAEYVAPVLTHTNLNSTMEIAEGVEFQLMCEFKGEPKPIITWFKNNEILTSSDRRTFSRDRQIITFSQSTMEDEGLYKCEGKNTYGIKNKETKIILKSKSGLKWYGIIIGVLTMLVLVASVTTCINHINKKKLEKVLEEAGLTNFEKGQLDNFNPDLGIGDQVELLPYDRKYEFPLKNLKLGKILGSGAFGVVVQGEARGILPYEKVTTVAVKMVDRNAQQVHIKALVAELKILIHLGKHLNVVNLLGACTKNIARRELMVIEEYCRYGNLQTYLYRGRESFIDQIHSETGEIYFEIERDSSDRKISSSDKSWLNFSEYAPPYHHCSIDKLKLKNNQNNYTIVGNDAPQKPLFDKSNDHKLEKESATKEKHGASCDCACKEFMKPISTEDLLSWSFQVARGMEYLVSRRVLHGDLAARNILLADDDVVKICDFGLSKRTYRIENYKKTSDGPLPVKWMAIESIRDRVFSSQSDVWSFGIVLWEFFSLAKVPYPGMEADKQLFAKLEQGYRMEAPKRSNNSIYQLMLDCWSANPLNRPTFTTIAERLGLMLEDSVKMHYIKLNDPYLLMNAQRLRDLENDYLTMVTPPSFHVLSTPQSFPNGKEPTPGYVDMITSVYSNSPNKETNKIVTIAEEKDNVRLKENWNLLKS